MEAKIVVVYRPFKGFLYSLQRDGVAVAAGKPMPPERVDQVLQEHGLALAPRPAHCTAWKIEIEVSE